ncbi:hypothetical protein Tco_0787042 [Tanacetum coccineum]
MASQDARLSKFEADFKQQQSEMTNKIDTVLKAIADRVTRALLNDMVKNPKLNVNSTSLVLSARSYPTEDPQCSTRIHSSINAITICPKQSGEFQNSKPEEEEQEEKDNPDNINTKSSSPPDPSVSFITKKIIKNNDDSRKEEPVVGENVGVGELEIVTTSRYVVPTGRVKVPTGRVKVPAGRSKGIPAGRNISPGSIMLTPS